MKLLLEKANKDLLYQVEVIQDLLGTSQITRELVPYSGHVTQLCTHIQQELKSNLNNLSLGVPDTFIDILNSTQQMTYLFELVNTRLVPPIVRYKPDDRIGLLVLQWLHDSHEKISKMPYAISDGNFAIYPSPKIPPVYLLPLSRQRTLLYLPLLFHEVGHLLYVCHKPELDDLVRDFQGVVYDHFTPTTVRDQIKRSDDDFRQLLVYRWYEWIQEFFCDAVGLTIGGPCFLKAFSHFFCTRSYDQFYVSRKELLQNSHPITWLREKLLCDLAKKYELNALAEEIDQIWQKTADTLGIKENYEGTWSDSFFIPLRQALDDMLVETQPYNFTEINNQNKVNLLELLETAWLQFEKDPSVYKSWEKQAKSDFLNSS